MLLVKLYFVVLLIILGSEIKNAETKSVEVSNNVVDEKEVEQLQNNDEEKTEEIINEVTTLESVTTNDQEYNETKTMWSRFDSSLPNEEDTGDKKVVEKGSENNNENDSDDDDDDDDDEDDDDDSEETIEEAGANRQGKFLLLSLIQHHMFQVMRMTPSFQYNPMRPHDAFDFLRDNYPLPLGGVQKSYDFVVIGAGSAGAVIASRLSEFGRYSVLLLEAGGPEDLFTQVPLLAAYFQSTDYNWGYRMEKQEGICTAMKDKRCSWPKGKAIGGSSVINYMIYTRGSREDWNRIAADGNPGWSYDDVLPYFLKSEGAKKLEGLENNANHNKYGLLAIEYPPYKTKVLKAFLRAAKQHGEKIVDYNNGTTFGFSRIQTHTKDGWRHSTAKAFLSPFKTRQSLHVLPFSRVTKINIKNSTQTAKSVEYLRNGVKYTVKAKKEIILSAGTFGSAQLLMLSGIGPRNHLEAIGIPVIKDLPVGQNMYDHFCYQGLQFLVNCTGCSVSETAVLTGQNVLNWLKFGQGPMTLAGGAEGIGYIKTKISDEPGDYPDMELLFISGGITADRSRAIKRGINIDENFFEDVYGSIVEKPIFSIIPMLVHPKSKGYMRLRDSNPLHGPKFFYDYFSDRRDMLTMIEGIKHAIEITKMKAFQKYGAKIYDKPFPNCAQLQFGTDDYWECAVRSIGSTLHHQIATCKMGPAADPEAVVDNELRVHGIKRLRVGDASILPRPIAAHTHAPTVMIGERLADFVRQTWG